MTSFDRAPRALAAVLTAALLGCGNSSGPTFSGFGEFDAQVTGEVNTTFSGMAAFGTDAFAGTQNFGITLPDNVGVSEIAIVKDGGGRLAVGTHALGDVQSDLYGEFVTDQGSSTLFFISESGQVTITSSSAESLSGSISFTGENEFGTGTVQVTATFTAVCIESAGFSCD